MSAPGNTPEKPGLANFFEHSAFFLGLLLLLLLAASLYVITVPKAIGTLQLTPGRPAPYNLIADFEFLAEDKKQTAAARRKSAESEPDYYKIDPGLTSRIDSDYRKFFAEVKKREAQEKLGVAYTPEPGDPLQGLVKKLSAPTRECLLRIEDNPSQKEKLDRLFNQVLREGVLASGAQEKLKAGAGIRIIDAQNRRHSEVLKAEELQTPEKSARTIAGKALEYYDVLDKNGIIREVAHGLEQLLKRGNLVFDPVFTAKRKAVIKNTVEAARKKISRGMTILEKGKKVTAEDLEVLAAYRKKQAEHKDGSGWYKLIRENILLCLAVILAMGLYLFRLRPRFAKSNRLLWLLGLVTIAALLLNKLFFNGFLLLAAQLMIPRELIYFAIPIGFTSVVAAVVFGLRTALFVSLFVSIIAALPMENQFQMVIAGLLINTGGGLAMRNVQNYRSFFVRGFLGTALSSLLVAGIIFLKQTPDKGMVAWLLLFPFATGLVTAILAQLALFLLEMVFDVSTNMSLMLCCDFNHPLLKELQFKAPGTYHHCLMVSNLAEQAAMAANLDPVKARVCGLFHDVGKLVQPEYFVENNPGQDMHKDLDPTMSAMIIRSHAVKHGPDLARKYKLKKLLFDAITQHHGTDLIAFFYKKAQDLHPGEPVPEREFRYPGPLPEDKEICLVMLADCCEAASRSLDKPTPAAIEQLVNDLFRKKIRAGQLDRSHLTLRELSLIRKSCIETLEHMNHGRIVYPEDEKQDEDNLFLASGEKIPPS